jgi:hypothetical protein
MWRMVSLILVLAACAAPSRHFRNIPATRITVADSTFDVRVRGELAEAVRRNPQYAPRFGPIRARAGFAMAQVSGCRVKSVLGDQAVALGVLDCGGAPRYWPLPSRGAFSCFEVRGWLSERPGPAAAEFECDPA